MFDTVQTALDLVYKLYSQLFKEDFIIAIAPSLIAEILILPIHRVLNYFVTVYSDVRGEIRLVHPGPL